MKSHQIIIKTNWLIRAIKTHNFHVNKLKDNRNWTLIDTADSLERSLGSICEDILIASWCKTHEKQIRSFKYAKDALSFIREKKKSLMTAIDIQPE